MKTSHGEQLPLFISTLLVTACLSKSGTEDPRSKIAKMYKHALVLIADGSEEIEFVTIVDILRRASISTVSASVTPPQPHIECSRGIKIVPDFTLEEALKQGPYDIVILPGGLKGARTFSSDERVGKLLREYEKEGKMVAAICAAPVAIRAHMVFPHAKITVYPSLREEMQFGGYHYLDDNVVVDENLITSKGPSTAIEFALQIVESLLGPQPAKLVSEQLLIPRNITQPNYDRSLPKIAGVPDK